MPFCHAALLRCWQDLLVVQCAIPGGLPTWDFRDRWMLRKGEVISFPGLRLQNMGPHRGSSKLTKPLNDNFLRPLKFEPILVQSGCKDCGKTVYVLGILHRFLKISPCFKGITFSKAHHFWYPFFKFQGVTRLMRWKSNFDSAVLPPGIEF